MKIPGLFAASLLLLLPHSASSLPAVPIARPSLMREPLASRVIPLDWGSLVVEVTASGEAAIREIHRKRRVVWPQLDSMPFFNRLYMDDRGALGGLAYTTHNPMMPGQFNERLPPSGVVRIVLTGSYDSEDGETLTAFYYDSAGRIHSIVYVQSFHFWTATLR